MRWFLASTLCAIGLALSFLLLKNCLQFWSVFSIVIILILPWIVLFPLIALRGAKRAIIPVLLVIAGIISLMPHWNPMPIAASEANAVGVLLRMRTAAQTDRGRRAQAVISDISSKPGFPLLRLYRFEYEEESNGFRVAAVLTPQARSCGCIRNFAIASDGTVHYTSEPRAATPDDPIVDVPPGLGSVTSR